MSRLCECGCGQATRLARQSSTSKGWVRGQPLRFAVGHNARMKELKPVLPRLLARTDKTESCWLWVGHLNNMGYGSLRITRRSDLAHRLMHEELVGPIPDGLEVDHICRVRRCVNPAHLELVTHGENIRRSYERGSR